MRRFLSILLALGLVLSFSLVTAVPVQGAILNVPSGSYPTIQSAIDAAVPGVDTVVVAAGTYPESITLRDGVDVLGAGPGSSIIDGTGYIHVVTASNINTYPTVLDGFTITGGHAAGTELQDDGGGMHISNTTSLTINNCTFYLNLADDQGGGMYNVDSSPTVTNCTFSENSATWHGGGMYNDNSAPTITDCYFLDNTAANYGGGMCGDNSQTAITNCIFEGNMANFYGGGIYLYNYASTTLTNCTFWGNEAIFAHGGGMCNDNYSSPDVINCTFYDNTANYNGGAIHCWNNSSPTIRNNIFEGNTANNVGDSYTGGGIYANGTSSPVISHNDMWNNSPDNYSGCTGGTGALTVDPQFDNPGTGDFHLQPTSLCIDAGLNGAVPGGVTTDFEGDPRIWDGDAIPGADVDMGIDEYYVAPPTAGTDADFYHTDENVTVSGSGFLPGVFVYVYVVAEGTWTGGESIGTDIGDGMDILTTDGSGNITNQTIWTNPLLQGDYDVVFDTGNDGTYDLAVDAVDDPNDPGFTVLNYAPNDPTNLGPAAYVDGSWGTDDTPTLQFDQSDNDVNDQVQYRIQIDNTAGFVSPEVDFTSALMAQGTAYYTPTTPLTEDEYYWRVMTYDEWGDNSNWVEANGGNVAFRLDTTPATGAGTSNDAGTLKDEFLSNENVYVTGNGFTPDTNSQVDVYVTEDGTWTNLDTIASHNVVFMVTIDTVGGTIDPDPALLWPAPLDVGEYDVVFDVDQDGVYNAIPDFVDDPNHPGFVVIPPGGAVGGEVYPIDKAALLLPWLALALALILAAGSLILVRRQAHR